MKQLPTLLGLVLSAILRAESWYPLAVGNTWEYDYRNTVAYSAPGGMTNITEGRMTVRIVGKELRHGTEYYKAVADYHGLFGMEPASIWLREDREGMYSAMEVHGSWREMRALRYPVKTGEKWAYDDGEPGFRHAGKHEAIRHKGLEYADALRVRREYSLEEKAKVFEHTAWYVRGKGEVRYVFKQEMGPTLSLTETFLLSFAPGVEAP